MCSVEMKGETRQKSRSVSSESTNPTLSHSRIGTPFEVPVREKNPLSANLPSLRGPTSLNSVPARKAQNSPRTLLRLVGHVTRLTALSAINSSELHSYRSHAHTALPSILDVNASIENHKMQYRCSAVKRTVFSISRPHPLQCRRHRGTARRATPDANVRQATVGHRAGSETASMARSPRSPFSHLPSRPSSSPSHRHQRRRAGWSR